MSSGAPRGAAPRIVAIETAVPPTVLAQEAARDIFAGQPGLSRLGARLTTTAFDASGIQQRHTVVDALATGEESALVAADGTIRAASTGTRNALYAEHASPLALEAARRALTAATTSVISSRNTGSAWPGSRSRRAACNCSAREALLPFAARLAATRSAKVAQVPPTLS